MKTAIFNIKKFELDNLRQANQGKHELSLYTESLSLDTINFVKNHEAVVVFTNDVCSAPVLYKLHEEGIKHLATRSVGVDHIDLKVAHELGISVANVPEYSPFSIAEHSVALMLTLNRKIIPANNRIKLNNYTLDGLIGFDMNGKTVGIVGTGRIGAIVAKILYGFGCKLLGFDLVPNKEVEESYGLEYVSLEELFSKSDIITLQIPYNEHTKYLINKDSIAKMKNGVMIINTARGGVLNTIDAIEGIKSGKIGALGLDVYEKEKGLFFYDHSNELLTDDIFARLLTFPNVVITGHQAFLTQNALNNIFETTILNLNFWATNFKSPNEL